MDGYEPSDREPFEPGTHIYRTAILRATTHGDNWTHVCRQWRVDPANAAYGVEYAKERGRRILLITTDVEFVSELPSSGELPAHEWDDVREGWTA